MIEKTGRNDPCPCGSGHRFQAVLHDDRPVLSTGIILDSRCPEDADEREHYCRVFQERLDRMFAEHPGLRERFETALAELAAKKRS